MIDQVSVNGSTWTTPPARFEAGTLPIVQAIALGTAVDWIQRHGLDNIHRHEQTLLNAATRRLTAIPGMKIYGPETAHKGGIISFRMDQVHPEDLAAMLDRKGVFTRHGHHCTMPLHQHLNVSATTRVSFGAYNTIEDIDVLIEAIEFARRKLRVAP
jgi:cysteine desulfurase/selenocysteine lyase